MRSSFAHGGHDFRGTNGPVLHPACREKHLQLRSELRIGPLMLSQSLSVTEVRSGDPELAATRYFPAETQRSMATPLAFVSCMMSAAGSAFVSRAEGHS